MKEKLIVLFLFIGCQLFSQDYKDIVYELDKLSDGELISIIKGDSLMAQKKRMVKNFLLKFDDESASTLGDMKAEGFKNLTEAIIFHRFDLKKGETPYHYIARTGKREYLELLPDHFTEKYSVNSGDKFHEKAIYKAITEDNTIETVEALIKHGADIDIKDEDGTNLLHVATKQRNITLINLFLDKGLSINSKNKLGVGAVHIAAKYTYDKQIIDTILAKGAIIDNTNFLTGKGFNDYTSIMHTAATNNWMDVLEKGLQQGLNVDEKINKGRSNIDATPLFFAVKAKSTESVRYLINKGANVNVQESKSGYTPLVSAMMNKDVEIFDLLFDNDVNVNQPVPSKGFPIEYAFHVNDDEAGRYFANKILSSNAYIVPHTNEGMSIFNDCLTLVGAQTYTIDDWSNHNRTGFSPSPLHWSAMSGWSDICESIVKKGTPVDFQGDPNKFTPLQYAVQRKKYETAKALLVMGANPNIKNKYGENSLDIAKENKDKEMVKILKNRN